MDWGVSRMKHFDDDNVYDEELCIIDVDVLWKYIGGKRIEF